ELGAGLPSPMALNLLKSPGVEKRRCLTRSVSMRAADFGGDKLFLGREESMRQLQRRWVAWAMTAVVLAALPALARTEPPAAQKGTKVHGQIVRVQSPDRFVIRTADKREVILQTNKQTSFLLNKRAARFADLREG